MATAAESRILPARIHVFHLLRVPHFRQQLKVYTDILTDCVQGGQKSKPSNTFWGVNTDTLSLLHARNCCDLMTNSNLAAIDGWIAKQLTKFSILRSVNFKKPISVSVKNNGYPQISIGSYYCNYISPHLWHLTV